MRDKIARNLQQVVSLFDLRANQPEERRDITFGDTVRKLSENCTRSLTQKGTSIAHSHGTIAKNRELFQGGKGVAHTTAGMAGNDLQSFIVVLKALLLTHVAQAALDVLHRDAMEIKTLATGKDRLQDLLRIGGAQDEHHVRRRFLKRLEEGIKCRWREHVDLVDDIDLVGTSHRGEAHRIDDLLAHVVDAGARSRVELVDIGMRSRSDGFALRARSVGHAARCALSASPFCLLAQKGFGENARHGGLARAARATEQVRVRQTTLRHRVFERRHDMPLPHNGIKGKRAIFSVERFHGCSSTQMVTGSILPCRATPHP